MRRLNRLMVADFLERGLDPKKNYYKLDKKGRLVDSKKDVKNYKVENLVEVDSKNDETLAYESESPVQVFEEVNSHILENVADNTVNSDSSSFEEPVPQKQPEVTKKQKEKKTSKKS